MGKMETKERDPRIDPKPGDSIRKTMSSGWITRTVVNRRGNCIFYQTKGKERACWISTWVDWARKAEVIHAD